MAAKSVGFTKLSTYREWWLLLSNLNNGCKIGGRC